MKRTRLTVLAVILCFAFFPGCASNHTIVTLNDNEYPSGWTPQFAVTAINVVSEEARNNTTPTN